MRTGLILLLLLFFIAGCKSKNKIPGDVLPPKEMQGILWDLMRADQFLADYILNQDSSKKKAIESQKYYEQIFDLHKVSKEKFQHSFTFYKSHPVLLKSIMDSISTPSKDTIVKPIQPEPVTLIPLSDTIVSRVSTVPPDSLKPGKKKKRLVIN